MPWRLVIAFVILMMTAGSDDAQMATTDAGMAVPGGGGPLTPCVGGQLDFSDLTGCNMIYIPALIH